MPTSLQPSGDLPLIETRLDHDNLVIGEAEKLINKHVHPILPPRPGGDRSDCEVTGSCRRRRPTPAKRRLGERPNR